MSLNDDSEQIHHLTTAKKSRRAKPRLELAADQPLTTQGRPRARVYVACVQCRTRKIRCDGAKPACHNCTRRAKSSDPCVYDAAPKRRGPDKTPGARQRMGRDAFDEPDADPVPSRRRRRKKDIPPPSSPPHQFHSLSGPVLPLVLDPQLADIPPFQAITTSNPLPVHPDAALYHMTSTQDMYNTIAFIPRSDFSLPVDSVFAATTTRSFISPYQDHETDTSEGSPNIISEPSLEFARQTWWESLLAMYSPSFPSIPTSERQQAANHITSDLRFFLRSSNYWLSFINVPRFLSSYFDPDRRARMQPSFLPAILAIATFFQSSEAGFGRQGRKKAMRLRDVAQGALEASLNARWIDEELAQAAWLLALFEVCAHPDYTTERCSSALVMVDTIIRTLALTFLDVEDPDAAKFFPCSVPSIRPASRSWANNSLIGAGVGTTQPSYQRQGCSCAFRSLGQLWPAAREYTPLWLSAPGWDSTWSEAEIKKEICRRLCWSTLVLTAGHTAYITSVNRTPTEFFILEPANFALLFPAEAIRCSDGHSGKDTIWSLNYRTMLLWHSCLRMLQNPNASGGELVNFGLDAWLEADALEQALNSHECDLERAFLFQGREYLFNVRMTVAHEFQFYEPVATSDVTLLFHKRAKEWLAHQGAVAQCVIGSLGAVTGHGSQALVHRPFFTFWFMGQISRALSLWERDNSLSLALDVCATFFKPIDYLSALWPCPEQRRRLYEIRERFAVACRDAGRPHLSPISAEVVDFN